MQLAHHPGPRDSAATETPACLLAAAAAGAGAGAGGGEPLRRRDRRTFGRSGPWDWHCTFGPESREPPIQRECSS